MNRKKQGNGARENKNVQVEGGLILNSNFEVLREVQSLEGEKERAVNMELGQASVLVYQEFQKEIPQRGVIPGNHGEKGKTWTDWKQQSTTRKGQVEANENAPYIYVTKSQMLCKSTMQSISNQLSWT